MRDGYDINRISGDGYLVLPLSMIRLAHGQDPETCYKIFNHFAEKLEEYSSDVVLLYTSGLYFNSEEPAYKIRQNTNEQILNHADELRNLIQQRKDYMPRAFHYLQLDYVLINSPQYQSYLAELKKLEKEDEEFRSCIEDDIGDREYNEANVRFILEEVVTAHIIRQKLVRFPQTLVRSDDWRLIVYPGGYIHADVYQWKHDVLPKPDDSNQFGGTQYNFDNKEIRIFSEIDEI